MGIGGPDPKFPKTKYPPLRHRGAMNWGKTKKEKRVENQVFFFCGGDHIWENSSRQSVGGGGKHKGPYKGTRAGRMDPVSGEKVKGPSRKEKEEDRVR